jgi:hypothetical protein
VAAARGGRGSAGEGEEGADDDPHGPALLAANHAATAAACLVNARHGLASAVVMMGAACSRAYRLGIVED